VKTSEADDVLRVPNAAIKLRPTREVFTALHEPFPEAIHVAGALEGLDDPGARKVESVGNGMTNRPTGSIIDGLFAPRQRLATSGQVWIYESGQLKRVPVMLGITDGNWTELEDTTLKPGQPVATGIALTTVNPGFMVR
jgi:hypothetical protein